jgi:hypothetical protein
MKKIRVPHRMNGAGLVWLPYTRQASLTGVRVVGAFEGPEPGYHLDDEVVVSEQCFPKGAPPNEVTAQDRNLSEKLIKRLTFLREELHKVERQLNVVDLASTFFKRFCKQSWFEESRHVGTFDDVDTLDVFSGSHPTCLSVRSPEGLMKCRCRPFLFDHLSSKRNLYNNKL